jgi:sialate O-acetylesterase
MASFDFLVLRFFVDLAPAFFSISPMQSIQNKFVRPVLSTLTLSAALLAVGSLNAEVRMPSIFSHNMVLQQGTDVPVWGWASEGEPVTVICQGKSAQTIAKGGKWMVKLKKLDLATAERPEKLVILGKNTIEYTNVLVGEVWLASGQSNMEWPLSKAYEPQADIDSSANPNFRLFTVDKCKSDKPLDDLKTPKEWAVCGPTNSPSFSAVGFYFGRALQKAKQVPVGVIHTSWGGSPAEVWMDQETLSANPSYKRDILDKSPAALESYNKALEAYKQKAADAKAKGQKYTNAVPRIPWVPCELYNGMIHPLAPFAVKGSIWYQGESNAGRAYQYRTLFADMIKNWRKVWKQSEFDFMLVQLAPFRSKADQLVESEWAELREAQLLSTKVLSHVGMAVITDVGEENDIHPRKKAPVGERLALAARGIAYKEKGLVYSGPLYKSKVIKGDKIVLSFDHVGNGLVARDGDLTGFAICGADKKWVAANAKIEGKNVVVCSPQVKAPVAVRFGWANFPIVNLWNKNGLPATPFRTDDFPMITKPK